MFGVRRLWVVRSAVCLVTAASASLAVAQKPDAKSPSDPRAQNEAALRQASKDYFDAVQRGDTKALIDFWTADGVYIDDTGQTLPARELLEKSADAKNAPHPATKMTETKLRFLTADSATEDGTSEVTAPGKPPVKGRFSAVWVRQNSKWKLDSVRESHIAADSRADQLAELEPFVGEWTGQMGATSLRVTAKWNPSKSYLQREVLVTSDGKSFGALQFIGWDPIRHQIRSWVFDANGGYGEGLWSQEGNVWIVLSQGVHANGKTSRATHLFQFTGANTLVWKTIDATLDKQHEPDSEVTFTRGGKTGAATGAAPASSAEAAKKAAILASDSWKRVQHEFNEWAKVQVIYTPKQMAETKAKLATEIDKMSAAELQQFVNESEGKLKLVLGKDADEARAWLGQYLSLMSDGYRKQFIGQVPDFVNMTSSQIRDEYLRLRSKLLQQQQAQAAFDANSNQVANAATQANVAAEQAAQQAAARSGGGAGGGGGNPIQSHYTPPQASHSGGQHNMKFWEYNGHIAYEVPGLGF